MGPNAGLAFAPGDPILIVAALCALRLPPPASRGDACRHVKDCSMPSLPNAQHEKFVQELIRGKSHADAYLAAGYKAKSTAVASAAATRLLKDPAVQKRMSEFQLKAELETAHSRRAYARA
jgi:Terminase small subunit